MVDEAATLSYAAAFAKTLEPGLTVYLHGDLGAGKTTFVRGVLQSLGHHGKVKSPTYNLVETYHLEKQGKLNVKYRYNLHHFDLYRFNSENEWDAAGLNEYFNGQSICMIEWPERALNVLPSADIEVYLTLLVTNLIGQSIGRQIALTANSTLGQKCVQQIKIGHDG